MLFQMLYLSAKEQMVFVCGASSKFYTLLELLFSFQIV